MLMWVFRWIEISGLGLRNRSYAAVGNPIDIYAARGDDCSQSLPPFNDLLTKYQGEGNISLATQYLSKQRPRRG